MFQLQISESCFGSQKFWICFTKAVNQKQTTREKTLFEVIIVLSQCDFIHKQLTNDTIIMWMATAKNVSFRAGYKASIDFPSIRFNNIKLFMFQHSHGLFMCLFVAVDSVRAWIWAFYACAKQAVSNEPSGQ